MTPIAWRHPMSDVSKCANGETCCLRTQCHRYLCNPSPYQSWFSPPSPGKECEYFLKADVVSPR